MMKNYLELMPLETDTSIQLIHLLLRFQRKTKFKYKVMVWMATSVKGVSNVYVHRGKQARDQKILLKECINRRLLPFVDNYHSNGKFLFRSDLARPHCTATIE